MPTSLPVAAASVAVEVLVNGARSRAQLAKHLRLSPATLTRLVRPLIDAGVLVETEAVRTAGRGRSSLPLDVVVGAHRYIGVKVTSDASYAVLTDLRANVLSTDVVAVPSHEVSDVVATVAGCVKRLAAGAEQPVRAIGVTVGGHVENGEMVADSSFLDWHGVPLRALLAHEVDVPVHLANDVVGLTRAQQWFGHGRAHADFALLTVGAGVGYGLVIDSKLVDTFIDPVSHLPIDPHGPLCAWGHRGCLTAYVTSAAMTGAVEQGHGRPVTYDQVLDLAAAGDPVASRVTREAAYAIGRATGAITSFTGVERIILSGEGVEVAQLNMDVVNSARLEYTAGHLSGVQPVVRPMTFFEWARGAAVVGIQGSFPWRAGDQVDSG